MKPSAHFSTLVTQTMVAQSHPNRALATREVARAYPDLAKLASAQGKTKASIQFLNSRLHNRAIGPADKAKDRSDFHDLVQQEMKRTGCGYDSTFNRLSASRRQFSSSTDLDTVRVAMAGAGGIPTFTPAMADVFRLPKDLDPQLWAAAWKGNGSAATPVDYGKIFDAIADKIQAQSGRSIEDSVANAKSQFPDLWKAVEELAKLSF